MVIVNLLRGGLGNQLFQYAAAFSIAKKFGFQLEHNSTLLPKHDDDLRGVSRWPEQISAFSFSGKLQTDSGQPPYRTSLKSKILTLRFTAEKALTKQKRKKWNFLHDENIDDFLLMTKEQILNEKIYMYGYFQRLSLFETHKSEIYNQVSEMKSPSEKYLEFRHSLDFSLPVVHFRLGDKALLDPGYTQTKVLKLYETLRSLELGDSKFRVFTDTPSFFLGKSDTLLRNSEIFYAKELTPFENLHLLAGHEFIVGSDSSFFWWASELQKYHKPEAKSFVF